MSQAVVTAGRALPRVSWRAALGYALYALLAFAVFLVWFFPVEGLQTRLLADLERRTQATITVQQREWAFPLGLAWKGMRIAPAGHADRALDIDSLDVDVAVLPLLRRRIEADLAWEAYGGKARGSWSMEREGDGTRFSLDQFGQGFQVARLPGLPEGSWQGVLQVTFTDRWLNDAWWLGEGTGSIEIVGLKVDGLTIAGFPVNGIAFESVTGQVALNGGTIALQRLAARGPLGQASGDGTVLVRAPWTESVINLTLRLEPTADAKARVPMLALAGGGPVTLRISGRLAKPGVSINGTPVA